MIDAQSSDHFRLNHADFHIQNLGSFEDLRSQVAKIVDQIQSA
jgi:dephospho-CoA kinase